MDEKTVDEQEQFWSEFDSFFERLMADGYSLEEIEEAIDDENFLRLLEEQHEEFEEKDANE